MTAVKNDNDIYHSAVQNSERYDCNMPESLCKNNCTDFV